MKQILFFVFLFVGFSLTAQTQPKKNPAPNAADTSLYSWTDEMPEFPGGEGAMMRFINKNLEYPKSEKDNGIQGTVWIECVVETNGSISNIKIIRGVTGGDNLSKEAIRIVSIMPKFKPGKLDGKIVRSTWQIPVRFSLQPSDPTDSVKIIRHGG